MTNRPDLIEQLSKLTLTEGEWVSEWGLIHIDGSSLTLFATDDSSDDDDKLIVLAPTMRIEILKMAKEIEELKKANEFLEQAREEWSKLAIKLRTDLERK